MGLETCLRQLADAGVGFTVKHISPSGEVGRLKLRLRT